MADPGLFVAHFDRGRQYYDERRFDEAAHELEEACLLRPGDLRALNLLGLVYFKQQKYEKAEEVYRRLAAASPEAATLQFNLGLIYLKLNRLDESESAFLKALDLAGDNPKIHFYLGSIYERLQRFPDAIYQYRQAGASGNVRRVEDRLPQVPAPPLPPPPPGRTPKRSATDDTNRYVASDIAAGVGRYAAEAGKRPGPVNPAVLAPRPASSADTSPFRVVLDDTIPPGLRADVPTSEPAEGFRLLQPNLLQAVFEGRLFVKQGTVYSYSGNLTFWVKDKRPGASSTLVIVTGNGRVLLTDKEREITFLRITAGEVVCVEPSHLLACDETLAPRYVTLGEGLDYVTFDGHGTAALSLASRPLTMSVTPELPVSVPFPAVITWNGKLTPRLVEDPHLREILLPDDRRAAAMIRLEGNGRVLLEQVAD